MSARRQQIQETSPYSIQLFQKTKISKRHRKTTTHYQSYHCSEAGMTASQSMLF